MRAKPEFPPGTCFWLNYFKQLIKIEHFMKNFLIALVCWWVELPWGMRISTTAAKLIGATENQVQQFKKVDWLLNLQG